MSISALVAPQLPLLRRYARALSGTQASGDAYVMALLEALIADPSAFDKKGDPRVNLYKLFSQIWNTAQHSASADGRDPVSAAERRISGITPLPRQAFLLSAVEGFTPDEVAMILDLLLEDYTALMTSAGQEIGKQIATRVMIIEDEPIISMDLEILMSSLGHAVVGNARTHTEAVMLAKSTRPGLVLADIRLADGSSGLDAVNEILETFDMPVIFITAYPESLLTGKRPEPTFLITKPFREETVTAVVSQALFFGEAATARDTHVA